MPRQLRVAGRLLAPLDLPGGDVTGFTDEQQRAIGRRGGSVMVSAGAGSGKTSVLVERFAQAVLEDGCAVDSILAITFTEKAAAQLIERVRARLLELGEPERAREAEAAWISTIHGFCARLLRTHALAAGLDPDFHVLDALEAERLAIDAFDKALAAFIGEAEEPGRLALLAAYTPDRLADMVRTAHGHLRSKGQRHPRLQPLDPPRPAGQAEALEPAARAALAELAADESKSGVAARAKIERCLAVLAALGPGAVAEPADVDELRFSTNPKVLRGPACAAYLEAHAAYVAFAAQAREQHDHVLLRELMAGYDERYDQLKRERSGLDFDDLELVTRDLLRAHEGICRQYRERFTHVMVDEFQDTNPLQNELLELLEDHNLFRVGDERQSIYGFRHADVDVFRRHLGAARAEGRAERMTVNFRSRGEVLDAVDMTFESLWGEEFDALVERPGVRDQPPRAERCVELLVTDLHPKRWQERFPPEDDPAPFGTLGATDVTIWRQAEARLLAKRIGQLCGPGRPFAYGDCVLLLRATTHMGVYERALADRGIATHVLGGRGYWAQQQVSDLRHYLAALANPLDELALHSVLASPLGGLSLDTLVVLAARSKASSGAGGIWRVMREDRELAALLPGDQLELLKAFADRFTEDRAIAPRVSLETLIDRAVTRSGYDRHLLALPQGTRRMANVRKLMRMAREFEADEGRDLRGFIDFVAERDLVQAGEGQAPLEAEDLDAVRLMTVHRAKGLEFPLVCVADLGKTGREDDAALRVTDDGRTGMRLASLSGKSVNTEQMERIKAEQKAADEQEERRVFYVAATRAEEHLVLSGATDLEKLKEPEDLTEPMRWLWRALAPRIDEMESEGVVAGEYEGREVRVGCRVLRPADVDALLPAADRTPVPPEPDPPGPEALAAPALAAVPVPAARAISRLSYSGLAAYHRCGYRFYLERGLGLPRPDDGPARAARGGAEGQGDGLSALARGSAVHVLLEELDFGAPMAPPPERVAAVVEEVGGRAGPEEIADLTGMVEAFVASPLAARLGEAASVRAELPFAFTLDDLLIDGIVDVHAREGDRVLVVDYKSDRLEGATPADRIEEMYGTQRLVYALAALRSGAERVEVAYCFLERPGEPVTAEYTAADQGALEEELRTMAAGVSAGRFEPTQHPHRGLCADCPGRPALCSWSEELTLAEPAAHE